MLNMRYCGNGQTAVRCRHRWSWLLRRRLARNRVTASVAVRGVSAIAPTGCIGIVDQLVDFDLAVAREAIACERRQADAIAALEFLYQAIEEVINDFPVGHVRVLL